MWTSLAEFGSGILIKVGIAAGITLFALLALWHHDAIIRKEALADYNKIQIQEVIKEDAANAVRWQELHKVFEKLSADFQKEQSVVDENAQLIEVQVLTNKDNDPNAPSSKILKDTVHKLEGMNK